MEAISKDKRDLIVIKETYNRVRLAILEAVKTHILPDAISKELFDSMNELTEKSVFMGDGFYCLECGEQEVHENHLPVTDKTHLYKSSKGR
jgi:hypothetical protein